jgi:hypothetical protein
MFLKIWFGLMLFWFVGSFIDLLLLVIFRNKFWINNCNIPEMQPASSGLRHIPFMITICIIRTFVSVYVFSKYKE